MMNKTINILLLLILSASMVMAENTTITQYGTVSVQCNEEYNCVILGGSSPVFFTAQNVNQTVSVPVVFSYQPNVTVLQNVTIIQNITNLSVTTTNVTVQSCDKAPVINITAADILPGISTGLLDACKNACAPGQDEKNGLVQQYQNEKDGHQQCELNLAGVQAALQTQANLSETKLHSLNETMTAQVRMEQEGRMPLWVLVAIAVMLASCAIGYTIYRGRRIERNTGSYATAEMPGKE